MTYQYGKRSTASAPEEETPPLEVVTSSLEMSPEQIDDYKKQMQQKYEDETKPTKTKEQHLDELQQKLGELDEVQL